MSMKAKVSFEVEIPEGATRQEAEAWLRFELHDTSVLENRNPLLSYRVEPANEIEIEFEASA